MNVGEWLDHMDKDYHHRDHRFIGWVFCDLLDYYYGQSAWSSLTYRRRNSGLIAACFLAAPLAALKFSNQRMKWGLSKGVSRVRRFEALGPVGPPDETDTTKEQFDAMWKESEPADTIGPEEP